MSNLNDVIRVKEIRTPNNPDRPRMRGDWEMVAYADIDIRVELPFKTGDTTGWITEADYIIAKNTRTGKMMVWAPEKSIPTNKMDVDGKKQRLNILIAGGQRTSSRERELTPGGMAFMKAVEMVLLPVFNEKYSDTNNETTKGEKDGDNLFS